MPSIKIKISRDGSSREYLFNKLGPVLIGSDERCDLKLEDSNIESKLLEVKVSNGRFFIKELGSRAEIYLNGVIVPFRQETPYKEGEIITLKNTNYQIQVGKAKAEVQEPPPFSDDFKARLEELGVKIKDKQTVLSKFEDQIEKKKETIDVIDNVVQIKESEKENLVREVDSLKFKKDEVKTDLTRKTELHKEEESRFELMKEQMDKLNDESKGLNESILRHDLSLERIKNEIDEKSRQVGQQNTKLSEIELSRVRVEANISEMMRDRQHYEQEVTVEKERLQKILSDADSAMKDKVRLHETVARLVKEREEVTIEVSQLNAILKKMEASRKEAHIRMGEIKLMVQKEEAQLMKVKESYKEHVTKEQNLKSLNEELRQELIKIEDKLTGKKNQSNHLDFQNSGSVKKMSDIQVEMEKKNNHLRGLGIEEKAQELKLMGLKKEIQLFTAKMNEDRSKLRKDFEEQKSKQELHLRLLKDEISTLRVESTDLEEQLKFLRTQQDEIRFSNKQYTKEKVDLENQIATLEIECKDLDSRSIHLKNDQTHMLQEKGRMENELSILKIKLLDSEAFIKQKEKEAFLEIESFKREERSKMTAEKEIMMTEIETYKQKSLLEVDNDYRTKQNELYEMKIEIQKNSDHLMTESRREAELILSKARALENEINVQSSKRLKAATDEAESREEKAHTRIQEAHDYFKHKEQEGLHYVVEAKRQAHEILKNAEVQLQEELIQRKSKVKGFIAMKQERGLAHIRNLQGLHIARMKKEEEKAQEKLDLLKRKELKKIAFMRDEEMSKYKGQKENISKELKEDKDKAHLYVLNLKRKQEAELAETKKTVLEHLNQTKIRQQQAWEEQISREKNAFEMMKRQRTQDAAYAILNLMITQLGSQPQLNDELKLKIQSALEMSLNGHNLEGQKKSETILEFNPTKKKEVLPVLKKYAVRFGIPAAAALVIFADVGSVRTKTVDLALDVLKQHQSASDIFVQNQKEEWKEKYTYNPPQTPGYKDTYADNVLLTPDFVAVVESEAYQNDWILKLHDFMVKELELSEDLAITFISAEGALIKDLSVARNEIHPQHLDVGLKKMTDLEKTHMSFLDEKIADAKKMDKFVAFRKDFYNKYYKEQYLPSKAGRDIASEKK